MPGILDRFYEYLNMFDETRSMVRVDVGGLKKAQMRHWNLMFNHSFGEDHVASIVRIGEAHYGVGMAPRWYIAGYQRIMLELMEIVGRPGLIGGNRAMAATRAIGRAVMLDLDRSFAVL